MAVIPGDPPPSSTDLEGWRQAIAGGHLRKFRLESIAAAFQDLADTDQRVREQLAQHLSNAIIGMLRNRVDVKKPNCGEDIIFQVHEVIFVALLNPGTADGKQLRQGFGGIVNFRTKDAIAQSLKDQTVPAPKPKKSAVSPAARGTRSRAQPVTTTAEEIDIDKAANTFGGETGDEPADQRDENKSPEKEGPDGPYIPDEAEDDAIGPGKINYDPALMAGVRDLDDQIDVQRVLEHIPDYTKQLAFSLHMDREPQAVIAKACNVSTRTIRTWIKEIQESLRETKEAQELLKLRSGAKS